MSHMKTTPLQFGIAASVMIAAASAALAHGSFRPGTPAGEAPMLSRVADIILSVEGEPVATLENFYRKVWSLGDAGVTVPLQVERDAEVLDFSIHTIDRYRWYHLPE